MLPEAAWERDSDLDSAGAIAKQNKADSDTIETEWAVRSDSDLFMFRAKLPT